MRGVQELRRLLSIEANEEDIKKIFEREQIANIYKKVRHSYIVEQYYQGIMEGLKKKNKRNILIRDILDDEEIASYNEKIIKSKLLNLALEQMLKETTLSVDTTVMAMITEENILKAIDDLEEVLEDAIKVFCINLEDDIIFRVGLKFLS